MWGLMVSRLISAPFQLFREGLGGIQGYCLQEDGTRFHLAFEPWATESERPFQGPCLRMTFRRVKNRIVLERFVVCEGGEERTMDLAAAHDALQAWMDVMAQ